jgi:hypothetical protein
LGYTTFTITGPDFVCSGFSRPVNFAFAIKARVQAFGEPAVDRGEKITRLRVLALVTPEASKAGGGARRLFWQKLGTANFACEP